MANGAASYIAIADEIRRRIETGELAAGDRVPSTREITRTWGVAMATASKVIATLTRQGLVTVVPGVGTVVTAGRPQARSAPGAASGPARRLSPRLIVRAAIGIADAEGVESLTMRRIGAELGVAAMSLYRHVPGKDELLVAMAEEVLRERPLPERAPPGWRARLELAARHEWQLYRGHLWLSDVISFARPLLRPAGMRHTEWMMRAVDGLGLDPDAMVRIVLTVASHVWSSARLLAVETEAELSSGETTEEWWVRRDPAADGTVNPAEFPLLFSVTEVPSAPRDANALFEFGLQRLLDGIAAYLPRA